MGQMILLQETRLPTEHLEILTDLTLSDVELYLSRSLTVKDAGVAGLPYMTSSWYMYSMVTEI